MVPRCSSAAPSMLIAIPVRAARDGAWHVDPSGDAFAARATAMLPEDERQFTGAGPSVSRSGRCSCSPAPAAWMLFVAANDLAVAVRRLRSCDFSRLYLLRVRGPPPPTAQPRSGAAEVLPCSAPSSAFLHGAALVYGFCREPCRWGIADAVTGQTQLNGLLLGGIALMAVGMLFKVAAVPFQSGLLTSTRVSPTPVTAFMASRKVRLSGAMLRLFYVGSGEPPGTGDRRSGSSRSSRSSSARWSPWLE